LVGAAVDQNSRAANFVARVAPGRTDALVTRLDSYVARRVAITSDGVIWTMGWIKKENGDVLRNNVLKRFDTSGRNISTASVLAPFRKGLPASIDSHDFASLKASFESCWMVGRGKQLRRVLA
jgi:hypothetical protein